MMTIGMLQFVLSVMMTIGNTNRNEKRRGRLEVYWEEEGEQEDLVMVGERESVDDDNLELGDDDLV